MNHNSSKTTQEQAWIKVNEAKTRLANNFGRYRNYAKSAPALVMTNGLIATLAYYQSRNKNEKEAGQFREDLCELALGKSNYSESMKDLLEAKPHQYMEKTESSLEVLKWMRQFCDAIYEKEAK